jgi:hypothetical protein
LKTLRVVLAGLLGLTVAAYAQAGTQINVRFDLGQAPPPRVVFHGEPHMVYVPTEQVYVVNDPDVGDYDCFRYQGSWYAFNGGYWYRSTRWNGQWMVIHPARVPVAIYRLPQERWKHRAVWVDAKTAKKEMHEERKEERREDKREDHGNHGNHGDHGDHDDHGRDNH